MNRQFGALSGLAMVLIVLNHAIQLGLEVPPVHGFAALTGIGRQGLSVLQALGGYAVPTFLFISGGFVSYAAQGNPPRLSRKFLVGSIRHILIPYLIWSIVFYLVLYINRGLVFGWTAYLRNLVTGYPFHFIPLIVLNYALAPLMLRLGKTRPWVLLLIIGLFQLILLNLVYVGMLGFEFPGILRFLKLPIFSQTLADWGIYFPLGLVYGIHNRLWQPFLQKYTWLLAGLTFTLFLIGILDGLKFIDFPLARHLTTLTFVLLIPAIKRDTIPCVRWFERVGKRSYGLYLTHLVTIDLFLGLVALMIPGLLGMPLLLFPVLFIVGLALPIYIMETFAASPLKRFYRYIFG